jgi:hypothetical protein
MQDKLNLEFEVFQNKFHLNDCILGKLTFNKVSLGIKSVEIHLFKKELLLSIINLIKFKFRRKQK